MAVNLPNPDQMRCKGNLDANWKFFKESYQDFAKAIELDKKDKSIQASTLKTLMGKDCKLKLRNLKLEEAKMDDPDQIIAALDGLFLQKHNIIFERYQFYGAQQQPNEGIELYVDRLRYLITSCEFNDEEQMLRDRVVLGTKDKGARAKIFRKPEACSLKEAIDIIKVNEATDQQMRSMDNDRNNGYQETENVNYTGRNRPTSSRPTRQPSRSQQNRRPARTPENRPSSSYRPTPGNRPSSSYRPTTARTESYRDARPRQICKYCGGKHSRKPKEACPAFGKQCNKCGRKNHFQSMCWFNKDRINLLEEDEQLTEYEDESSDYDYYAEPEEDEESPEDMYQLETIGAVDGSDKIIVPLKMNGSTVECEVDTGAGVNAMSYNTLCQIEQSGRPRMEPTRIKLKLYNDLVVKAQGEKNVSCEYNDQDYFLNFKITKTSQMPIIGRHSALEMGLITVNIPPPPPPPEVKSVGLHKKYSPEDILTRYKDVFEGLGCLPGDYNIEIDKTVPTVKNQPRRVAVAIKPELKTKLQELEDRKVITKVTEPTDWISNMVVVRKPGKMRICLDPKPLNKALKRPHYMMPTVEDVLPKLSKARLFSVLDAKDGFWQIRLTEESSFLTTFGTPFGRYRWLRMPFGIATAPEEFQRRQHEIIEDLPGVDVIADDYLIYGCGDTDEEAAADHDRNLIKFLDRARQVNLKINKKKARLRLKEVSYMGHLITAEGLKPSSEKIKAIIAMPRPDNKTAVQRLMGCVTYLARFLPRLSQAAEPLRRLTDKDAHWEWLDHHEKALDEIKQLLTQAPVLKYYDVQQEVTIQCDASDKGMGATLLQNGQPVSFASQALTQTEQQYAQIEKECLAIVFACEKFDQYIYGRDKVTVHSDHKPLIPIFQKPLHSAPKRLQRMLLRLQKYELDVHHIPGKDMLIADFLSRAYLSRHKKQDQIFDDLEHINQLDYVNVSATTQNQLQNATKADATLMELMLVVQQGWPDDRSLVPVSIRQYYTFRDEITVQNGVLFKGQRIIVPRSMQEIMLKKTHSTHQGIEACIRRAKDSLFWIGMGTQIQELVSQCSICNSMKPNQQKESMMSYEIPERPWQIVAQDLFKCNNEDYLITVDFYSDYWEVDKMPDTLSTTVIECTKEHFSRHGIPNTIITDNGPQFISEDYEDFTRDWDIEHRTSSPRYSQSNGKAEATVKIAKRLIKKATKAKQDVYLAILDWRNTPNPDGKSPVQMLMSRRTRTLLPTAVSKLHPKVVEGVSENIKQRKQRAKLYYDRGQKTLPELEIGQPIRIQPDQRNKDWTFGNCLAKVGPRSYLVQTKHGQQLRRNRRYLRTTTEPLEEYHQELLTVPTQTEENSIITPPVEKRKSPKSSFAKSSCASDKPSSSAAAKPAMSPARSTVKTPEVQQEPPPSTVSTRSTRSRKDIKPPSRFQDYVK